MERIESLRTLADPFLAQVFGPLWYGWLILVVGVTALGYVIGFVREQQHYLSLRRREKRLKAVTTSNYKRLPKTAGDSQLVAANVALATDSFRVLSIIFRRLVGGRVRRYERINDRARREAMIRLKQATLAIGRNAIYNVRIQSSQVVASGRTGAASVEILAYGTAMRVKAGDS